MQSGARGLPASADLPPTALPACCAATTGCQTACCGLLASWGAGVLFVSAVAVVCIASASVVFLRCAGGRSACLPACSLVCTACQLAPVCAACTCLVYLPARSCPLLPCRRPLTAPLFTCFSLPPCCMHLQLHLGHNYSCPATPAVPSTGQTHPTTLTTVNLWSTPENALVNRLWWSQSMACLRLPPACLSDCVCCVSACRLLLPLSIGLHFLDLCPVLCN